MEFLNLHDDEKIKVLEEFKQKHDDSTAKETRARETEEKYIYDIRILNALATIGLKASSIAHRLDNKRNNISTYYEKIVRALTKMNLWEIVSNERNTKVKYSNVPLLLEENKEVNEQLVVFIDTMLSEIEPQFFNIEKIDCKKFIQEIINKWKEDNTLIKGIKLKYDFPSDILVLPKDILNVIFDNLILNSIQQNEDKINELVINIQIEKRLEKISVSYSDNGVGLSEKFLKNPHKILEVHQTSRKNGHGLGMWIVSNSISTLDGEITSIRSDNGFKFEFNIQEQEEKKIYDSNDLH